MAVAVPIMIQQGLSQFVSLLDNLMVGRLSTEAMSGVSIVNQFMFIFFLLVFGGLAAAGIFTTQYHGNGDKKGEMHTFRFKLVMALLVSLLGIVVFLSFDDELISLFLHESDSTGDLALTMTYAKQYMQITLCGMIPYAFAQTYALTLRETEQAIVPMVSGIVAILTNFILNLLLIFGLCGLPALGVAGAAIATLVSRIVELVILVAWSHTHKEKCAFLQGAYRSIYIPKILISRIILRGLPLMLNEFLWSLGMIMRNQCCSTRGLDAVAALNMSVTLTDFFNVVYIALGNAIAIIVGNLLGAGRIEEARDTDRKMIVFSVLCSTAAALVLAAVSPVYPLLYDTSDSVRSLATFMLIVSAVMTPFHAYSHAAFFTLRSGGKVFITFLFDSGFMWCVTMVLSFILAYATPISIYPLFLFCHGIESLKVIFGYFFLRSGSWAQRLVESEDKRGGLDA